MHILTLIRVGSVALAMVIGVATFAQDAPEAEAAAEKPVYSESHRRAAERVLELNGTRDNLATSVEAMLQAQIKANPGILVYEDIFRDFFSKYLSYAHLKDGYIDIYAGTFTEAELIAIGDFMETPAGKKMAATSMQLAEQTAQLGDATVGEHIDELTAAIEARDRETADKMNAAAKKAAEERAEQPE